MDLELKDVRDNLREKDITLEVEKALLNYLGKKGFDPVFGARPLRRVIQNEVEDRLSDALLEGEFSEGDAIRLDYVDGEVTAEQIDSAPPPEQEEPGGARRSRRSRRSAPLAQRSATLHEQRACNALRRTSCVCGEWADRRGYDRSRRGSGCCAHRTGKADTMTEQTDVDGYAAIIAATGRDASHPFYYGGSWCDGESGEFAGVFMFGWSLPRFRLLRAVVRGLEYSDMFPRGMDDSERRSHGGPARAGRAGRELEDRPRRRRRRLADHNDRACRALLERHRPRSERQGLARRERRATDPTLKARHHGMVSAPQQ